LNASDGGLVVEMRLPVAAEAVAAEEFSSRIG